MHGGRGGCSDPYEGPTPGAKDPLQEPAPLEPAFQSGYSRKGRCSADNAPSSIRGGQEAAAVRELALNRTPCFHFSPVAMGWVWLGQQPPYIGQSRNPCPPSPNTKAMDTKKDKISNCSLEANTSLCHFTAQRILLVCVCLCVRVHAHARVSTHASHKTANRNKVL